MSYFKPLALSALALLLTTSLHAEESTAFNKTLTLKGVTFHVTSPNDSSLSKVTIKTKGLKRDETFENEADGTVTDAAVADINNDGAPEVYVFVTSAGSGSYGSVIAYSSNRNISATPVYMPELNENKAAAKGYMGHDQFSIKENRLVRRFPVYSDKDSNANPTQGFRELQYELVPGEAGWIFKLVKRSDSK
jgi:hypothetical protein